MKTDHLLVGVVIGQRHTRCFAGKRFPPVPKSEEKQNRLYFMETH